MGKSPQNFTSLIRPEGDVNFTSLPQIPNMLTSTKLLNWYVLILY